MAVALIYSLLGVVSCQKNVLEPKPALEMNSKKTTAPTRASNSNRLVFSNWGSFDATLKDLGNQTTENLNIWENSFSFTSVRSYNAAIEADSTIADTAPLKALPEYELPSSYGSVLNNKGEVQVGDTIYVYKRGYIFGVAAQNTQLLEQVHSSQDSTFQGVSRGRFSSVVITENFAPTSVTVNYGGSYVYAYRYYYPYATHSTDFRHTFDLIITQEFRSYAPSDFRVIPTFRAKFDYFKNQPFNRRWLPAGEDRQLTLKLRTTITTLSTSPLADWFTDFNQEIYAEQFVDLYPGLFPPNISYSSLGGSNRITIKVSGGKALQYCPTHYIDGYVEGLNLEPQLTRPPYNPNRPPILSVSQNIFVDPFWDVTIRVINR